MVWNAQLSWAKCSETETFSCKAQKHNLTVNGNCLACWALRLPWTVLVNDCSRNTKKEKVLVAETHPKKCDPQSELHFQRFSPVFYSGFRSSTMARHDTVSFCVCGRKSFLPSAQCRDVLDVRSGRGLCFLRICIELSKFCNMLSSR